MNSFQNFHFRQNSQTFDLPKSIKNDSQLSKTKMHGKYPITFHTQENSHLVEPKLEEKNNRSLWVNSQYPFDQDDSENEDYDELDPLSTDHLQGYDSDSEQEEYPCSYYNSSIAPEYLTMSRIQRQNYFERLNTQYMKKMSLQSSENLNSISDDSCTKIKKRPAIKFSNVVYQVPFSKQDQPINVRYAIQEQFYSYQNESPKPQLTVQDSQSDSQMEPEKFENENEYFDEFHVLDFDQKVNDQNMSDLGKQKTQSEESINGQNDIFQSNIEIPMGSVQNIEDPDDSLFDAEDDEEEKLNPFKRDSSGKYLSETSSSDSNSNDSNNEWKEVDYNEEFESYFALFLQGRKINPNTKQAQQASN